VVNQTSARGRPVLTLERLVVATFGVLGWRIGIRPISDNSTFAHLRTGIDMVERWAIPRHDPYSFSAPGHRWVVQSWLASFTYGLAHRAGGIHGVVVLQAVITAATAVVAAFLARTGVPLRTVVAAGVGVAAGASYWAPRPLMFGLLALGLMLVVVEGRRSPWWLVPIIWVWVNTHGSFPLGGLWLAGRWVGEALDGRAHPRWLDRYAMGFVAGLGAAALNPLGPRLLAFPLTVEAKRDVFKTVVEWRSPDFQSGQGLFTLVLLCAALLVLTRRRVGWADALPVVGFVALGLVSVRNIAPAAIVLAPALGRALRPSPWAAGGTAAGPAADRPALVSRTLERRLNLTIASGLVVVVAAFTADAQASGGLDLSTYPVRAVAWMDAQGLLERSHRVAEQDVVGDYLILRDGARGQVFIDDRFDMYPTAVSDDYDTLLHGGPSFAAVLHRYRVDTVLWSRSLPLVPDLEATGGWSVAYQDRSWAVLRPVAPG